MPKPIPVSTPRTHAFWQGGFSGELKMQGCKDCGHVRFPPGPVCTSCLSDDAEWVGVSRQAQVLSHLVFHRGYGQGWNDQVPYSVLFVQLPEGPRMFLDLIDPDHKHIEGDLIGSSVDITFDTENPEIAIPRATARSAE